MPDGKECGHIRTRDIDNLIAGSAAISPEDTWSDCVQPSQRLGHLGVFGPPNPFLFGFGC